MMSYAKLFTPNNEKVDIEDLANGNLFSRMLIHVEGLRFLFG